MLSFAAERRFLICKFCYCQCHYKASLYVALPFKGNGNKIDFVQNMI